MHPAVKFHHPFINSSPKSKVLIFLMVFQICKTLSGVIKKKHLINNVERNRSCHPLIHTGELDWLHKLIFPRWNF